jgi:hypothetical protein
MDVLYPDMVNTYAFSIEREGTTPHSIDRRIAATVIDIRMREILYLCSQKHDKQKKQYDRNHCKAQFRVCSQDRCELRAGTFGCFPTYNKVGRQPLGGDS